MNKNDFLNKLNEELKDIDEKEKQSLLEYYDEVISDAVEAGKDEIQFVESLGPIDSIIKKADVELKVKKLNEKPTTHRSITVLIAVLGAISTPILIPLAIAVVAVVFALIIAGASIVLAGVLSVISLVIAFVLSLTFIFSSPFAFVIPLALIGALIFIAGLTMIIGRFVFVTVIVGIVNLFKNIVLKKGGKKNV